MKRFWSVIVVLVLVLSLGLAAPAFSAEEGSVQVTIEMAQVSVTVNPGSVNYGVVSLDDTGLVPQGDPLIFARNTGNWWADFEIMGADTSGGWVLSSTPGDNNYVHYFGVGPGGSMTYNPLGTGYQELGPYDSYSPGSTQNFRLRMDTPTTSPSVGTQSTTVTVLVTLSATGMKCILTTDADSYGLGGGPAILTANVTDQDNVPVTGLSSFTTLVFTGDPPVGPPTPQAVTFTEGAPGIYTGNLVINTLTAGIYTAGVNVSDATRFASSGDSFTITP